MSFFKQKELTAQVFADRRKRVAVQIKSERIHLKKGEIKVFEHIEA